MYKSHVPGIIDKVYKNIYNNDGYEMRKVRVRSERVPTVGDKLCSKHGQKGTIGNLYPHADMPFTKNGLSCDLIINPNAIPSRMTVAQLIECSMSKVAAVKCNEIDGTPFTDFNIENTKIELKKIGFNENGCEYLYNGFTGKKMKSMIFIGPTYYQRLKHLVYDKIHSRSRGPKTVLTRLPCEGRAKDGGLKFGEMEVAAVIAHGMSIFLKERLMETADAFTTYVCDICGLFAQRMKKHNSDEYIKPTDIFMCPSCKNNTQISKIRLPYSFKLTLQELLSMNIAPRIITR